MSIPVYADLRTFVAGAVDTMTHPYKGVLDATKKVMLPEEERFEHRYGKIVYFEGGHVGVKVGDRYLIAEGDDHQDSVWGLAVELGAPVVDPGVTVTEVDASHFWLRCAAGV